MKMTRPDPGNVSMVLMVLGIFVVLAVFLVIAVVVL
jgi:hypothetical protein